MGIEQTMEFPDMETCLEVRSSILAQSENVESLCIHAGAEDLTLTRMDMFFDKFMDMLDRLEYRDYDPYLDEELLDGFITPDLEELE